MNIKPGIKLVSEIEGGGPAIQVGERVKLRLKGWLNSGDCFEDDVVDTMVGRRRLIRGLEQSLIGMKVGGVRTVRISPHLAYGESGVPGRIPPNAVLLYEIEVLEVIYRPQRSAQTENE